MPKPWYTRPYVYIFFFFLAGAVTIFRLAMLVIPQSGDIVRLAEWRLLQARSFHLETNVQYHGTSQARDVAAARHYDLTVETSGDIDQGKPADFRARQDFKVQLGATAPSVIGGSYRRVGPANFLTFSDLPDVVGGLHLDVFRGKTLSVNFADILASVNLPLVGGGGRLKDADRAALWQEARDTPFLPVEQRLRNESIHGVNALHYKIKPELLYVKDFVISLEEKRRGRELTSQERNAYDTWFSDLTAQEGEIWIGASDYYPYRLRLSFLYDDGKSRGTLTLSADFSNYNEQTSIALPAMDQVEDAGPYVRSLLASLMAHLPMAKEGSVGRAVAGGHIGLPVELQTPAVVDTDDDGLSDLLEHFYGCDPLNPDSTGIGLQDGEKIEKGLSCTGPWPLFDFAHGMFN